MERTGEESLDLDTGGSVLVLGQNHNVSPVPSYNACLAYSPVVNVPSCPLLLGGLTGRSVRGGVEVGNV